MFSLVCVWINGWVNNHEAGDLKRYRVHYDITVMDSQLAALIRTVSLCTCFYLLIDNALPICAMFVLRIYSQGDCLYFCGYSHLKVRKMQLLLYSSVASVNFFMTDIDWNVIIPSHFYPHATSHIGNGASPKVLLLLSAKTNNELNSWRNEIFDNTPKMLLGCITSMWL